ncbi:formylglycine-generating enzyme family protein [Flavihumibacter stibioxidans]|uniref:Sulfatase-modifying factor n=1 Tax=Flavihumibacter stibioxidans TaxID=1834163 RepID=A0ABR7M4P8_9BACT|nr:sulfatase-modifying factor [Flavihumibacter stibioxidans]
MKPLLFTVPIVLLSITATVKGQSDNFKAYKQKLPGSKIEFNMVPIPGGTFKMGSPATEKHRSSDEGPQRTVKISPFWMASFEASRDAFDVFWKDESTSQNSDVDAITRPSAQYIDLTWGMGKEGGFPVNSMSQRAAVMYCRWLYQKTGIFFRLPTEAEWEYACRAGSTSTYYFGNNEKDLGQYGWFSTNSANKYHKSGLKKPNAWGLYDMLGNVSEWTLDHYTENAYSKIPVNAVDPKTAVNPARYPKVLKGGGYDSEASELRPANRIKSEPSWNKRDPQVPKSKWWLTDGASVGFRVVRPLKQPSPAEANAFFREILGN